MGKWNSLSWCRPENWVDMRRRCWAAVSSVAAERNNRESEITCIWNSQLVWTNVQQCDLRPLSCSLRDSVDTFNTKTSITVLAKCCG